MALRKVFEIDNGNECARIYRDSEYEEYRVRFYSRMASGQLAYLENADYHTDDKQDAINTAKNWTA